MHAREDELEARRDARIETLDDRLEPGDQLFVDGRPVELGRVIVLKQPADDARRPSTAAALVDELRAALDPHAGAQRTDRAVAVPARRLQHGGVDVGRVPPASSTTEVQACVRIAGSSRGAVRAAWLGHRSRRAARCRSTGRS